MLFEEDGIVIWWAMWYKSIDNFTSSQPTICCLSRNCIFLLLSSWQCQRGSSLWGHKAINEGISSFLIVQGPKDQPSGTGTINRSIPSILPLLGQTRLLSQICQIVLKSMEMDREWMKRTFVYKQFIQEDVYAIAMQSHNETVFWSNHPSYIWKEDSWLLKFDVLASKHFARTKICKYTLACCTEPPHLRIW